MSRILLAVVLLVFVSLVLPASGSDQPQTTKSCVGARSGDPQRNCPETNPPAGRLFLSPSLTPKDVLNAIKRGQFPGRILVGDTALERYDVCFSMVTVQMAREEEGSESTIAVGRTTCVPATKFRVERR